MDRIDWNNVKNRYIATSISTDPNRTVYSATVMVELLTKNMPKELHVKSNDFLKLMVNHKIDILVARPDGENVYWDFICLDGSISRYRVKQDEFYDAIILRTKANLE